MPAHQFGQEVDLGIDLPPEYDVVVDGEAIQVVERGHGISATSPRIASPSGHAEARVDLPRHDGASRLPGGSDPPAVGKRIGGMTTEPHVNRSVHERRRRALGLGAPRRAPGAGRDPPQLSASASSRPPRPARVGPGVDEALEVARRHRLAEVVALHLVAALALEERQLCDGLDALGAGPHAQAVAETDHGAHDRVGIGPGLERGDERAIDLDLVERELLQVAQARVAGAEVVHGDVHAKVLELAQRGHRRVGVLEQDALGDLELETLGREARVRERAAARRRPDRAA